MRAYPADLKFALIRAAVFEVELSSHLKTRQNFCSPIRLPVSPGRQYQREVSFEVWRLFPRKLIHQSQRAHRKDRSEFLRIEIGGEAHVQGPLSEVQPYAALQRPIIELNIQVGNSESRVVPARVEPNDIRK